MSSHPGDSRRGRRSPHEFRSRGKDERRHRFQNKKGLTTVRKAVRYLLSEYDRMLEEQAHALMFLGEAVALREHQKQLTDASYHRDAYSVYSEDVSKEIGSMNLPSRTVYRGEHQVPIYDTRSVSEPDIEDSASDILDNVNSSVGDMSTNEIVEMCRQIPGVRRARLKETIDLSPGILSVPIDQLRNQINK